MDIEDSIANERPSSAEAEYTAPRPTESYTLDLPSAPRIVIPPLQYRQSGTPPIHVGSVLSNPDPNLNIDFLNRLDCTAALRILPASWDYATRREAQEVLSFLQLGPIIPAKDKAYLQRAGITMVLGVQPKGMIGSRVTAGAFKAADELGIEKAALAVGGNRDLISIFPRATEIINSHLVSMHRSAQLGATPSREGNVLIFCESGNDRSAAVVAAYLMETFDKIDLVKAIQMCCHSRFCCNFNDEIKQVLSVYEELVLAKRSIQVHLDPHSTGTSTSALHRQPSNNGVGGKRSRYLEVEEDNMDVDSDEADDSERFRGRSTTPFA